MTADLYRSIDVEVLERCAKERLDYTTSTAVTAMILGDVLIIGHVGDSRAILGKQTGGGITSEQLTTDHKADLQSERERIEKCGGMVEKLQNHNNKPFHRGGDFLMRKALGEAPMQLQYARAFGAKDLRPFGLICVPDVKVIPLDASTKGGVVVIASDGLWDVLTADDAAKDAIAVAKTGRNPAESLVGKALQINQSKGTRADNITCVCIFFNN